MSDIFNTGLSSVSEKEWRSFVTEASRPLVDAPSAGRGSQTADFARQLERANRDRENSTIDFYNAQIDRERDKEKEVKAATRASALDAKELKKLNLPDIAEQPVMAPNWYDAKKATDYDNQPFVEQSKIYNNWLDQAHVRLVMADRSKAETARAELEARIPAPTKPKAEWYNTDILDKMQIGYNSMVEGGAKVAASYMPSGNVKDSLYAAADEADAKQKELRKELSPETLDAEKATAFRKKQLIQKYGSEDAIPTWEGIKQGAASMTQGGVMQTIGNVGQSLASSLPSVAGNAMRIGGAALTATGGGAVLGVPLMAAGTAVASLGGAAATAGDVGGQAFDDAMVLAKSRGLNAADARDVAERAARNAGAAGGALGFVEGLIGAKLGAGSALKSGIKAGAKNLGVETVSEGLAEGAGQVAVNAALQAEGDKRSLMRGVGEAAAQGAIGGLGMGVGGQALATVTGAQEAAGSGTTPLSTGTPNAIAAGVYAASAATNNVAIQAQAAVVQAQAALAAAQQSGDDAQITSASAALQAATAQAAAAGPAGEPTGTSKIELLKAAAAAEDALAAAVASGDSAAIEQAQASLSSAAAALNPAPEPANSTSSANAGNVVLAKIRLAEAKRSGDAFNIAKAEADLAREQRIAEVGAMRFGSSTSETGSKEAPAIIDPVVQEQERMNGVQIRDMLDKVERIPQARHNATTGDAEEFEKLKPLAGAIGRADTLSSAAAEKKPWALSIEKGVSPIEALAQDETLEPAQRQAAEAVIAGYKVTGTAMPIYDAKRTISGNVAGFIEHRNISPAVAGTIVLNKKTAGPATIIHEYLHGLTALGLRFLERSPVREHKDVLAGLEAIITFLREHPSVTKTRAGMVYASTNTAELLGEALSGRVLPLTSNITVQDILDKGGLSPASIRGLEILGAMPVTPLRELFVKARDFVLNAMGIAAAKKGSVSDAILAAGDYAMEQQRQTVEAQNSLADTNGPGVQTNAELLPGYSHLGKNATGNFATSLSQLTAGLQQPQPGVFAAADGTLIDPADSIASMAERPAVRKLLTDNGFDGFITEAGEKFQVLLVNKEETSQAKALTTTIANISRVISSSKTTDAQRLTYLSRFLNGSHSADVMDAINQTGVGLTIRSALESQAPWAEGIHYRDSGLLQTLATSASDIGSGAAEQARAVLRMYAEAGADMPKVVKVRGLIPFDGAEAMGVYTPAQHMIEVSDLADPSHVIHEYLHGVTQLGIDAMPRNKEGKALRAVMEYMLATMRTAAVRDGGNPSTIYGLKDAHEMMGDLFSPAMLRVAVQTPVGTPQSKSAQALIAEMMGEKPSTMIQLLDAIIRKIVSYLGVKTVPNNMTELLSRVAARVTDETRKAVNEGIAPADALLRNEEVLPVNTAPLSAATSKNLLTGRISSSAYINNINNGVNVQPLLQINKNKALIQGDPVQRRKFKAVISDAVHDSQGPAKRWIQALPISDNAKERIINVLYLAPGKRDALLNKVMEEHGGDAVLKQLSNITKSLKGITHETVTQWVGHWITANHVAEKNAMLVAKRAKVHTDAVRALAANPNSFRLQLAVAQALQDYTDQIAAVSSTNLDAGSEGHPPHRMGVAGGMSNAQAAATMAAIENQIDVAKLREVAQNVYTMNAFRLALDIEHGKTSVDSVAAFLNLSAADQKTLRDLQDARLLGTVDEAMRDEARAIVRSEYVPMTGHPLSAIDDSADGLFSTGAAQPNTGKDYAMEGRTRGIADNGIATSMKGLIRSATFAGFADFTTSVGEVYEILSPEQRSSIGLSKDTITGLTRGSDNVLLDGRTNNTVGYSIADPTVLEAIRFANVDTQQNVLHKILQPMTKTFAYLVTQANPMFGPRNLINDMIERSLIASTREYHTETGTKITVGAMDVVANAGMSMAAVNRLIRGKADYAHEADVALRDFIEAGGLSTSREAFARDAKQLAERIRSAGVGAVGQNAVIRSVGGWIEKYNKQFDMVAPLASYLALRHAGVSKVDAAGGALDLMNYRKKGAKTAGFVTPMYAFAQPAFTGGANMLRALGTRKGQTIAVTSFIALISLQMLAEAGADEDEGGNLIRQMPNYARNNNLNVQLGSYVVSTPIGFGLTKFVNTIVRAILDFGNKGVSIPKTMTDILSEGFVPALSPFEDNDIKDPLMAAAYGLAPTVFKGVSAYVLNARPDGGEIDREKWIDRAKYRHMQGSKTIEPEYRALAINLYDAVGWDMTPDAMKYLIKAYALGPFKYVVTATITNPAKEAAGKDTGLPGVGMLIAPVYKPINEDAWRGQVRKAQEEMDELRKEESKLLANTTQDGRVALRELQRKPEYRLMAGYDDMDKSLRNESAAVTRSVKTKQITASAEATRRESIRERRADAEAQFLVRWRKMKGLE